MFKKIYTNRFFDVFFGQKITKNVNFGKIVSFSWTKKNNRKLPSNRDTVLRFSNWFGFLSKTQYSNSKTYKIQNAHQNN